MNVNLCERLIKVMDEDRDGHLSLHELEHAISVGATQSLV